jgi:predicted RNA-binding Zn-ribbon protein involved in translation (DUF1610 family)
MNIAVRPVLRARGRSPPNRNAATSHTSVTRIMAMDDEADEQHCYYGGQFMSSKRSTPKPLRTTYILDYPLSQVGYLLPRNIVVSMEKREGVYLHSFQCNDCGLHFNIYSWKASRHRVATVHCPECGQHAGRFRHQRVQLSNKSTMDLSTVGGAEAMLNGPGEIYRHCPPPGAQWMDDTTADGLRPSSTL